MSAKREKPFAGIGAILVWFPDRMFFSSNFFLGKEHSCKALFGPCLLCLWIWAVTVAITLRKWSNLFLSDTSKFSLPKLFIVLNYNGLCVNGNMLQKNVLRKLRKEQLSDRYERFKDELEWDQRENLLISQSICPVFRYSINSSPRI